MERLACVDVPALPLQILLARRLDWRAQPVAVVAEDTPLARILWVNERAWKLGILPGQRYAEGLAILSQLRGAVVSPAEVERRKLEIGAQLRRFSPQVEPAPDRPGVFWLNASGLERLYASLERWAQSIRVALAHRDLASHVVVGFSRFGVYATARSRRGVRVFASPEEERATLLRVPLQRLDLPPKLLDRLRKLGISTVGAFLRLPSAGVRTRFGVEAFRLHQEASGEIRRPLSPSVPVEPARVRRLIDPPELDTHRLLFRIKRLLPRLLGVLAGRREALAALALRLRLDHAGVRSEEIRPAAPTLDEAQILDLLRLRLEGIQLGAGVAELELFARGVEATAEQLRLFAERPRRDLDAAARALARVRADLGDGAVVRARLRSAHLPEASFSWEPLLRLPSPRPREVGRRPLVRRLLARPEPFRRAERARVVAGPYLLSGGWWGRRGPATRAYFFFRDAQDRLLWVFFDLRRRRWRVQGRVE